jgi:hypothetical protein
MPVARMRAGRCHCRTTGRSHFQKIRALSCFEIQITRSAPNDSRLVSRSRISDKDTLYRAVPQVHGRVRAGSRPRQRTNTGRRNHPSSREHSRSLNRTPGRLG